jgi:hypothetical protein
VRFTRYDCYGGGYEYSCLIAVRFSKISVNISKTARVTYQKRVILRVYSVREGVNLFDIT